MRSLLTRYSVPLQSRGFSLLEVMVALAILGIAVVAIFQLFSVNLRSTQKADDFTKAIFYARSMMDEAYSFVDPSDADAQEEFEERFTVAREVGLVGESENGKIKTYEIVVRVSWPPSGDFRIKGLKAVYASEE